MNYLFDIPQGAREADLVFKVIGDRRIELTFLPPAVKKYDRAPVYFLVSGGGWHFESRQSMLEFATISSAKLRNEGYAVVSIDYRVYSEENICMHDILSDCFDGLRYISHFSDILEIDPHNIAISGHSAGGHLVLMLAYAPEEEYRNDSVLDDKFTIKTVASLSPITIMHNKEVPQTTGFNYDGVFKNPDDEEEKIRVSPYTYVSDKCQPTILCAGTSDYLVYSLSSELLYDKLCENNVKAELVLSVGGGHCFEKINKTVEPSVSFDSMQEKVTEFILNNMSL